MPVCTQRSRHAADAVSSLVVLLEDSDSIKEFLIRLHSFARVSNTTIKGAPAGMGESARLGNGYPAAMCCLNCFVNDEIFFFEASGIHVGEKQPAIPANLRLDNSFDGLEMFH